MVGSKRSQVIYVAGPNLREKAQLLHQQFHGDSIHEPFKLYVASTGCQWRFCQRHMIRQLPLQGEKLQPTCDAPSKFREKLVKLMEDEGYTLEQI